jgi:hypothetical protein
MCNIVIYQINAINLLKLVHIYVAYYTVIIIAAECLQNF